MNIAVPLIYFMFFISFMLSYFNYYAPIIRMTFLEDFGNAVSSIKDCDSDRVYITANSQRKGFSHVSEILSLYYLDIDAEEYQSMDFSDKYRFRIPSVIDESADYVYVLSEDELDRFDPEIFEIIRFERFYTAVKRA